MLLLDLCLQKEEQQEGRPDVGFWARGLAWPLPDQLGLDFLLFSAGCCEFETSFPVSQP